MCERTGAQIELNGMLLAAGADPNDADELGNRPLHLVCCSRCHYLTSDTSLEGTRTTRAWPPTSLGNFSLTAYA